MKKGSFDLTGKAIDCRELLEMGDAGKEIFRALKVACNGVETDASARFSGIKAWGFLVKSGEVYANGMAGHTNNNLLPVDVLGQARIDAAKDGATLVFEGDQMPIGNLKRYWLDGSKDVFNHQISLTNVEAVAYKPLEERLSQRTSIESRVLAEKVGGKHSHYFKDVSSLDEIDVYKVCELFEVNDPSGAKQHAIKKLLCSGQRGAKDERKDLEEARDTIVRKLAMMAGVDSRVPQIDLDSEPPITHDAYDELREANLELVRENMALKKENEALVHRIKVLHRAGNGAKAALDV